MDLGKDNGELISMKNSVVKFKQWMIRTENEENSCDQPFMTIVMKFIIG